MPREKILSSPAYWFEKAQNELFRQFHFYMEREKINQTQLGERLGITKGRVSQILQGQSNFTMRSLIELGLSIGVIPKINYIAIEDEVHADIEFSKIKRENKSVVKKTEVPLIIEVTHYQPFKIQSDMIENLGKDSTIVQPGSRIIMEKSTYLEMA